MKTCNPKYEHLIPELIRQAIGTIPLYLTPIPTVPDSIVYEAVLPMGAVIFKTIDPDSHDSDGIGLEAWMCETVRALGVPAPCVLAVDTSTSLLPASYFIMEKASGLPLITLPAAQQAKFLRQIGMYLRQIHTIQVEHFGWLDEQHYRRYGTIRGSDCTWREAVMNDIPESLAYFKQIGALETQDIHSIERILELSDRLLDAIMIGQLLHGDLGGLHTWVDPEHDRITAFVDFGQRSAGDPVWDIMRFEWEGVSELIEGYELDRSLQARFWPTFYLYGVLQAIPWARKWYARGGVHTVEWLKTTIREATPILGL